MVVLYCWWPGVVFLLGEKGDIIWAWKKVDCLTLSRIVVHILCERTGTSSNTLTEFNSSCLFHYTFLDVCSIFYHILVKYSFLSCKFVLHFTLMYCEVRFQWWLVLKNCCESVFLNILLIYCVCSCLILGSLNEIECKEAFGKKRKTEQKLDAKVVKLFYNMQPLMLVIISFFSRFYIL